MTVQRIAAACAAFSLALPLVFATAASAARAPKPDAEAIKALAPSGRMRVAINLGNAVLAQKDAKTGALGGVSVALAKELGKRLGVPVDFTTYDAAGMVFDAMEKGAWDVAFLANEPERAQKIDFSPPYVVIDGTFLVRADSKIRSVKDVDAKGVRVAVARGAAYDLFLTRNYKNTELVKAQTSPGAIVMFKDDATIDAAAGVRQALVIGKAGDPKYRVLDDAFNSIEQAVAVPKGHEAGARYIRAFIEEKKADGFVRKALDESGQKDAAVAPPAKP